MGFQIGLDVPGSVFESYLHPRNPIAESLPALGKLLGSGLDLALGDPSREQARARYRPEENDQVFVDEAGNISETPIPDSTYGGVAGSDLGKPAPQRLFQDATFDGVPSDSRAPQPVTPASSLPGAPAPSRGFPPFEAWARKNCPH